MKLAVTQLHGVGLQVTATAGLVLHLPGSVPPVGSAELLGVDAGTWRPVSIGDGLALVGGELIATGGGGGGDGSGYTLTPATTKALGGVIAGANLTIAGDGTLSLTGGNVVAALGLTPVNAAGAAAAAPVQSVAGRTGTVTLVAADVGGLSKVATTGAYGDLSGTPAPYSLPQATGATLGGVTVGSNLTISSGTLSLTGANVQAALGLTPVSAAGAAAAAPVQSVAGRTGTVTLVAADVSGLAASATTDTTNATNISSGTLASARLPAATGAALGGVIVGSNLTVASGTLSLTAGNVQAALGLTPVNAAGAAAAAPVQSVAGRTGTVTLAAADVSGLAASATTDTTNATNISTGTLASARLPAATGAARGGVTVGSNLTIASGTISLTGANVQAALGLTPVDAAGAAAAAPVQSVAGSTGAVTLPYGMTVDFSQGAPPVVGVITLDGYVDSGVTVTALDHCVGSAGGTVEASIEIVSKGTTTPIGGLSAVTISASTVTSVSASSANKASAGDRLQINITKVTGTPAGAFMRIRGTRP